MIRSLGPVEHVIVPAVGGTLQSPITFAPPPVSRALIALFAVWPRSCLHQKAYEELRCGAANYCLFPVRTPTSFRAQAVLTGPEFERRIRVLWQVPFNVDGFASILAVPYSTVLSGRCYYSNDAHQLKRWMKFLKSYRRVLLYLT